MKREDLGRAFGVMDFKMEGKSRYKVVLLLIQ
jgi:hypothetical protein